MDQILEGGVVRLEKQWLLTVRLYDAEERLLWANIFEDHLSQDLLGLREEIRRITEQIVA